MTLAQFAVARSLTTLLLAAAGGVACAADSVAPLGTAVDQTGNGADSFAAQYVSHGIGQDKGHAAVLAKFDYTPASGWTAGTATARADGRYIDNGRVAQRSWAGYGGKAGALGYDASLNYYAYPGARRSLTGAGYNYGELSTGLHFQSLSARYNYTMTRDFFGVPDARGSGYLDLGMRHALDQATCVALHAGDGHVAGNGNANFDWRDVKAGMDRKLHNGWNFALNYTRALGAAGPYDRMALPDARPDGRPAYLNGGRRAVVLSMARSF